MKFFRQLSAVMLTVAIVVGLGMLWAHASGAGTGTGGTFGPSGTGFHLADTSDLIQTCEIEAGLAAVVITVSAIRRRRRRSRSRSRSRTRMSARGGSMEGWQINRR